MKRLFLAIAVTAICCCAFAFDGATVISVSRQVAFLRQRGNPTNALDVLLNEDEWRTFSREECVSNLVSLAISSELSGNDVVRDAALDIIQFQPYGEEGARLFAFAESYTNLSSRIPWFVSSFSMMGDRFVPIFENHTISQSWSVSERRAIYRTAGRLLSANGSSILVPKTGKKERERIGRALLSVLPTESDVQSFRMLDWILIDNHPGWAFSTEHFELLSERASQYMGEGPNPYEKTLQTMMRRLSEGDTNIVHSADKPIRIQERMPKVIFLP